MLNRRLLSPGLFLLLSLVCLERAPGIAADTGRVLFEENFASDLDKGWSWVRESHADWKLDKDHNQLLIHTMPGVSLYMEARSLTNILVRRPPESKDGALAFEVHVHSQPTSTYEQAGIIYYFDDDNIADVIKEKKYGKWVIGFGVKKNRKSQLVGENVTYDKDDVDFRLVVSGTKISGWYRASSADPWQKLGETDFPASGPAKIGLEACSGPSDKENWASFREFRIVEPAK